MDFDATQEAEFVGQIASHQAALHAYIISLMPGLDGVSDVLQETNIVLWEKRFTFQPGTNFRAWACAIARFKVKAHRRKLWQPRPPMLDEALADLLAAECVAESEEFDERLRALEKCLCRLQDKERKLIEHRYFSKANLEDFATQCGRPVDSLRVSLFRIRAALKNCIVGEIAISQARL